ncbi:MAG: SRPBCC domain-containing protein [Azospirillaceae bacterium]
MAAPNEARRLADDELLITRTLDAPVTLVFRIWEEREHMVRWLGPKDFICTHLEMDFRPGGRWRACIESAAYGESWMGGEYKEIERDRRIVYSFAWEDGRDQPGVDTLITVTFREENGHTVQSFHQAPFLTVESRDSHVGGWNECLDREQAYAERLASDRLTSGRQAGETAQ